MAMARSGTLMHCRLAAAQGDCAPYACASPRLFVANGSLLYGLFHESARPYQAKSPRAGMTPRLPHSDGAILDIRKIEDYCLSPSHRAVGTRLGYFVRLSTFGGPLRSGCDILCLKPHDRAKPGRWRPTLGGPDGASMLPSGDTVRALW
jgi:hypothetical protein